MKFSLLGVLLLAGLLGSVRLQEAGDGNDRCELKVRQEYNRCHVKVLSGPKGPNRVAAEQLCREVMDNDMADCRSRRLQIGAPEATNLPNNLCVRQVRSAFAICITSAEAETDDSLKAGHIYGCQLRQKRGFNQCLIQAGLPVINRRVLESTSECLANAKAEYSKCYGKAASYRPGNDRNAAIKLCDEILDNDSADCRSLQSVRKLEPVAPNQHKMSIGECVATAKAEYSKCYGKAVGYKPGNDRDAAIKLCDEILDNDTADCRARRLQIAGQEPVNLPNNLCVNQVRNVFSICLASADRQTDENLKAALVFGCQQRQKRGFNQCLIQAGLPILGNRRLQGVGECVATAKAEYSKCYGKAVGYKPGNDRDAAIKLCDEILDNDTADCRALKGLKAFADQGADLASANPGGLVRRNLVQTKRQCLKIAGENFVKCQQDVAKLPNWSGDDMATIANARQKCRKEFDKDQDECDGRPMSR